MNVNTIIAAAQAAQNPQAQATTVAAPLGVAPAAAAVAAPAAVAEAVVMQPVAVAAMPTTPPTIPAAAPQNDWMAKLSAGFGAALNEASNDVIPAGTYKVQVKKFEFQTSKEKGLPMVKKEYQIIDGVHAGRKLSEFAVLGKQDGTLNAWGISSLKAQMEAILKTQIADFNTMITYLPNIEKAGAIATVTVKIDGQYNRVEKLAL